MKRVLRRNLSEILDMRKTQVPQLDYLSAVTISSLLSGGASDRPADRNLGRLSYWQNYARKNMIAVKVVRPNGLR